MSEPSMEQANVSRVNLHDSGPTEEDEMDILASLFFCKDGVFFQSRYDG